jgi:hypothetical protein
MTGKATPIKAMTYPVVAHARARMTGPGKNAGVKIAVTNATAIPAPTPGHAVAAPDRTITAEHPGPAR